MPTLTNRLTEAPIKMLLVGDSGTGKTGSLASLALAGYRLRILDYDNGLDPLSAAIAAENPEALALVDYKSFRDKKKLVGNSVIIPKPSAYVDTMKALTKWAYDDGTEEIPAEWGTDTVLVIDSLTHLTQAAMNWAEPIVASKSRSGEAHGPAVYGAAQDAIKNLLDLLTSPDFGPNVIFIAHGDYFTDEEANVVKIVPKGPGKALGPTIPSWFNTMLGYDIVTRGNTVKREIRTTPSRLLAVKAPGHNRLAPTYPIETGLADIFTNLRKDS